MSIPDAHHEISHELLTWNGVQKKPHRFGGLEYRMGSREIGHVHGDYLVDIPFPKKIRDELVHNGQAKPHHILPNSGWTSFYIQTPEDVPKAIELLRKSYELILQQPEQQ